MDVDPSQDQDLVTGYQRAARRRVRVRSKRTGTGRLFLAGLLLLLAGVAGAVLFHEMRTSRLQARHLAKLASKCTVAVEPGPSPAIHFPRTGPYDERLGYVALPSFISRLTQAGFGVVQQARFSPTLLEYTGRGFFPPYREKAQAGLHIVDRHGHEIFSSSYPELTYPDFNSIPDIAVKALLFIENRELLDNQFPNKNPAVEWGRLAAAVYNLAVSLVERSRNVPGGSTLAVQLEKYRHSPHGITSSLHDKFTQMVSASTRAYLGGEETRAARYQIVLDFVNSIPLGAIPGHGEITGLGDGLSAYYGADFVETNRLLATRPASAQDPHLKQWAMALKQVLSLFIAQRRPSSLLDEDRPALKAKTDSHLRLLAAAGIIRPWERDAALPLKLNILTSMPSPEKSSFLARKAANAVRTNLLNLLGVQQFYQLNHLDLSVKSSIDQPVQQEVTTLLKELNDPVHAREAGLNGFRMLENSDPAKVIYSLTLYERTNGVNLLRIQTDTFDQPLDINAGIKLELGSSAKLRTLVTYLDVVATLHQRYAGLSTTQLQAVEVPAPDSLSRWAVDYLTGAGDKGLSHMLAAAMQRRYSASPDEVFYTGGGEHTFVNFDHQHDHGIYSVQQALENSINLVFIRLMRDIVRYYQFQIPGVSDLLSDASDPRRQEYLARFADQEGTIFQQRFYRKYAGKPFNEAFATLLQAVHSHPARLAAVFRYLRPEADQKEFTAFMATRFANPVLSAETLAKLYKQYAPESFSLVDRGYIARIHPLELWTVSYLRQHPNAGRSEVLKASSAERQAVYSWLFKTSRKNKQDRRIRDLVEVEAFSEIHAQWEKMRYPFDSLVPSYATAIGSSADRPAALAELVGIIINDGKWYPSSRIQELCFAAATPYETRLLMQESPGEQVLAPEVAAMVREALLGVVANGTAQRVHKAYVRPDGTPMAVGGKTGTGDNRHEIYGSGGRLIESKVINRTAVFVFYLDQRFFGAITAYVAGPAAANYKFTSALPVQVLKVLAPKLMVLAEQENSSVVVPTTPLVPLVPRLLPPMPSAAPAAPAPAPLPAATAAAVAEDNAAKATAATARVITAERAKTVPAKPVTPDASKYKATPAKAATAGAATTEKDKPIFIKGRTDQ